MSHRSSRAIITGALVIGVAAGGLVIARGFAQGPASQIAQVAAATVGAKEVTYAADHTTDVLIDAEVDADQIVRVVRHGDHWHVFTRDGREIITYTDPSQASSAHDLSNTAKVVSAGELTSMRGTEVVKILRHGDHYHVFTADGREFITYTDPSAAFPGVAIGTYTGSHGHVQASWSGSHASGWTAPAATGKAAGTGGTAAPVPGLSFVRVVGLDELSRLPVVRILRHADHYHAYLADGTEYITYDNPASTFPHIQIGAYAGNHGGADITPAPMPAPTPERNPNDPKRVVKILRHEDHWHLILADGTELVTHTDPSAAYPHIKIGAYDPLAGRDLDELGADELFDYGDVEEGLRVPLDQITYGGIIYTIGFNRATSTFIVPHLDHYHNISVEMLIQAVKLFPESFGNRSARDVVATLKYLVRHPEARPHKEGWGAGADGGQQDLGEFGEQAGVRRPLRIVHVPSQGQWIITFEDGSTLVTRTDPATTYPDVPVLEPGPVVSPDMTDEQIIATWSERYGMSTDEFEDILLELPAAPLNTIEFRPDRTVVIFGATYPFRMPDRVDEHEDDADQAEDAEDEAVEDERVSEGEDEQIEGGQALEDGADQADQADRDEVERAAEEKAADAEQASGAATGAEDARDAGVAAGNKRASEKAAGEQDAPNAETPGASAYEKPAETPLP